MGSGKMIKLSAEVAISVVPGIEILLWDTRGYSRRFVTALSWDEALKLRDLLHEALSRDGEAQRLDLLAKAANGNIPINELEAEDADG